MTPRKVRIGDRWIDSGPVRIWNNVVHSFSYRNEEEVKRLNGWPRSAPVGGEPGFRRPHHRISAPERGVDKSSRFIPSEILAISRSAASICVQSSVSANSCPVSSAKVCLCLAA